MSTRRSAEPNTPAEQKRKGLSYVSTREVLIRCGMELLTERGFAATGLDAILQRADVPKGSFYHHFGSKNAFGTAVLAAYNEYFQGKLDRWLLDESTPPLGRIRNFVMDASRGMTRHRYTRGCLVGNFGQELSLLPPDYRELLNDIFASWSLKITQCLLLARADGQISPAADCNALAQFFWIGWEGAIMRSRMTQTAEPLELFIDLYMENIAL